MVLVRVKLLQLVVIYRAVQADVWMKGTSGTYSVGSCTGSEAAAASVRTGCVPEKSDLFGLRMG